MKKILVVSLLAATTVLSHAANVASTIAGVGSAYDGVTGTARGNYAGGFLTIAGSLDGDSGLLPTTGYLVGYVVGPSFSASLTINPTSNEFGAGFALPSTGSVGSGIPTDYFIKFYDSAAPSTVIASGAIKLGTISTPEPQTYAMAAGAALLGFAAFRRARR